MDLRNALSEYSSNKDITVCMKEVIIENDPRSCLPCMIDAKKREIRGILERGAFRVILREEIAPDANVLPGHFVLTINQPMMVK